MKILRWISSRFRWYVWPRLRWATICEYCRKQTGLTMYAWATEDICEVCSKTIQDAYDEAETEHG